MLLECSRPDAEARPLHSEDQEAYPEQFTGVFHRGLLLGKHNRYLVLVAVTLVVIMYMAVLVPAGIGPST